MDELTYKTVVENFTKKFIELCKETQDTCHYDIYQDLQNGCGTLTIIDCCRELFYCEELHKSKSKRVEDIEDFEDKVLDMYQDEMDKFYNQSNFQ